MPDELSRRELLLTTGAMAMGLSIADEAEAADLPLPHRILGKTGVRVPILGFGTAPAGE